MLATLYNNICATLDGVRTFGARLRREGCFGLAYARKLKNILAHVNDVRALFLRETDGETTAEFAESSSYFRG